MNTLARELNEKLEGTAAYELLSDFGKRFFFPKGIAAQSAEATVKAKRYNATIGMAYDHGEPIMVQSLRSLFSSLTADETVAYAPNAGDRELRSLWAQEIRKKNPDLGSTTIGTPTVVAGLTNGIAQLADLFIGKGDMVIIPDMFWGNYRLIFETRHEAAIETFAFYTEDGRFNANALASVLAKARGRGKALLILNFPNNPTGYSPTVAEVDSIVEAIRNEANGGTKLLVVTDDAYFGLYYEPEIYPQSIFAKIADLHENVLAAKIDGTTKEDFTWGFRIGFITFAGKGMDSDRLAALEKKLLGAIRSSVSNCSRPAQSLMVKLLRQEGYEDEKRHYFDVLHERYRTVRGIVDTRDTDILAPLPFNSGYFMSFRVKNNQAETLRQRLLDDRAIGTIAIQDSYLRIAYSAVGNEVIEPLYDEVYAMAEKLLTGG